MTTEELGSNSEPFTLTRKVGYALKFYGNRNNSIGLVRSGGAHYIEAAFEYLDGKVRNLTGHDNLIYNMHYNNSYNYLKYR